MPQDSPSPPPTSESAPAGLPGAEALLAQGQSHWDQRQWSEAALAYLKAHAQDAACGPSIVARINELGGALRSAGQLDLALACYAAVSRILPAEAAGYLNMGAVALALGDQAGAIARYRQALERGPDEYFCWLNLAAALNYSDTHGPGEVRSTLQAMDQRLYGAFHAPRPWPDVRDPSRVLRIGYVSPDLRRHAVGSFALPLIEAHSAQVQVVCYHCSTHDDDWTQRFRQACSLWVECAGLDDDALSARIRADGIDILIDLAGHTEGNRLGVFARRSAAVQASWLGYVTTSGLAAMDYRITHDTIDPPGSESHYTERLVRLPRTVWCWQPLQGMPEVSALPMLHRGYVRFGSLNRFSKVTPMVLRAWAAILKSVPQSHLTVCIPQGSVRQRLAQFFATQGIDAGRIQAFSRLPHDQYWALHSEIDIALDTFPFGGGTTTFETLWLGVPVVCCTGSTPAPGQSKLPDNSFEARFSSRMGAQFLGSLRLAELAGESVDDYVRIAVALARDPARLQALRAGLRERMRASPLVDAPQFAADMEAAYRSMWQEHSAR
ncbi:MAG: hypothetical protein Q8N17_13230 [Burkholderiaceae bacterium]|nr:hypothetical protein [Burkholderiaceae bacterium]